MNLLKSLVSIGSLTIFSRIMGFTRDAIIAKNFGAGMASDAFFIAFKIPNLLRRVFAEGAFSQAFIPILSEYKDKENIESTRYFLAHVTGMLILIVSIITAIGILASPWLVQITAPGFINTTEKVKLTASILRVTHPYLFLISVSSLIGSVLGTWRCFSISAFVPALLNVSMIIFALFLTPNFDPPIMALGWSVIVGGVLQILYQLPSLYRIGMLVIPKLNIRNSEVLRVFKSMFPSLLGISIVQISLLINTVFLSFLVLGSVSWMYYAERLMEVPSGVLGVSLGTIMLSMLSKSCNKKDWKEYSSIINWGLRVCFLVVLPCSLGLLVLARPIIVSLFQYGEFSELDVTMTVHALVAYSVGLPGLNTIKILAPAFYALKNIRTPVKIAMYTLFITQLLNLLLVVPLKHVGIALAISIGSYINSGLLLFYLVQQKKFSLQSGWLLFIGKILFATFIMAFYLVGFMDIFPEYIQGERFDKILRVSLLVFSGAIIYFFSLFTLGLGLRDFSYKYIS